MSGLGASVAVICIVVFQSGQITATFWQTAALPSDPDDPHYKTFQPVPPPQVTADKIINNVLHIYPVTPEWYKNLPPMLEDIVFVVDDSGSIPPCEFHKGKIALRNLIWLARANPAYDIHYAAVAYAWAAVVSFKFLLPVAAQKSIMSIPYSGSATNINAGLTQAKKLFDSSSSGIRAAANKAVFLLTDGKSNWDRSLTLPKAEALKKDGVQIFVLAVGPHIKGIHEMVKMASYPPERFLFRVNSLSGFLNVIALVAKKIAPGKYDSLFNDQYSQPSCGTYG
ncbi:collagen alpha-1(VI) chain-like [Montipora foliosa]|uniref:collagen alpha-1(VI) chain-like n=1 Tax=Montipora foliosa TaxID=591990 RepID=UPI0035F1089F